MNKLSPVWSFLDDPEPTSGKPASSVADVKALARSYTAEAVRVLAETMRGPGIPANVKIAAASAMLARGWGSPESASTVTVKTDARDMTRDELMAIARQQRTEPEADGPVVH